MDIKTTKMKRRERKGKAVIVIKSEIFVSWTVRFTLFRGD